MNLRNIFNETTGINTGKTAENYFSRMISRFTSGAIINIIIALFVLGILLMTFLYVGAVFLKNL
jgi:hypothetical protein